MTVTVRMARIGTPFPLNPGFYGVRRWGEFPVSYPWDRLWGVVG